MPLLKPGFEIPEQGLTLKSLLAEDAWGEAWRAVSARHGPVVLAFYTTPVGSEVFRDALPRLKSWQEHRVAGLAGIHELGPEATYPVIVAADPGGQSLNALMSRHPAGLDRVEAAKIVCSIAKALHLAGVEGLLPVGLAPQNIVQSADKPDQWQILPFPIWTPKGYKASLAGLYTPDDPAAIREWHRSNLDIYSLNLLWYQLITGNPEAVVRPGAVRNALAWPRLSLLIENNISARVGVFTEPKMMVASVENWIKRDASEDIREQKEAIEAANRPTAARFFHENRRLIIQVSALVGGLLLLALLAFAIPRLFVSRSTTKSPYGTMDLFLKSLAGPEPLSSMRYCTDGAEGQVQPLLADIKFMEDSHLASHFAEGVPFVQASDGDASDNRSAQASLKGVSGDSFIDCEIQLVRREGEWKIRSLLWKRLREPEPPRP